MYYMMELLIMLPFDTTPPVVTTIIIPQRMRMGMGA